MGAYTGLQWFSTWGTRKPGITQATLGGAQVLLIIVYVGVHEYRKVENHCCTPKEIYNHLSAVCITKMLNTVWSLNN